MDFTFIEEINYFIFKNLFRYYKKVDLPKKYNAQDKNISKYEVFLSNHKDFIMVDCINGLCNVFTLEEYDKLNVITPNTFFTRY